MLLFYHFTKELTRLSHSPFLHDFLCVQKIFITQTFKLGGAFLLSMRGYFSLLHSVNDLEKRFFLAALLGRYIHSLEALVIVMAGC